MCACFEGEGDFLLVLNFFDFFFLRFLAFKEL